MGNELEQELLRRNPSIRATTGLEKPYAPPLQGILNSGQRVGIGDILTSLGRSVLPMLGMGHESDPLEAVSGVAGPGSKIGVSTAAKIYRPVIEEINQIIRSVPAPDPTATALASRVTGHLVPHRTPINIPEYAQGKLEFPQGFMPYTSRPQSLIDEYIKHRSVTPDADTTGRGNTITRAPIGDKKQIAQKHGTRTSQRTQPTSYRDFRDIPNEVRASIRKDASNGLNPTDIMKKYKMNRDHVNRILDVP